MKTIVDVYQNTIMGNMICNELHIFQFAIAYIKNEHKLDVFEDVKINGFNKFTNTLTVAYKNEPYKIKLGHIDEKK